MKIGVIEGATRTIGEGQGYIGLPLRDEVISCSVGGPGTPAMVSAWKPSADEVVALLAGASLHLRVLGTVHPPVMLEVGSFPAGWFETPGAASEGEAGSGIKLSDVLAKAESEAARLDAAGDASAASVLRDLAGFGRAIGAILAD